MWSLGACSRQAASARSRTASPNAAKPALIASPRLRARSARASRPSKISPLEKMQLPSRRASRSRCSGSSGSGRPACESRQMICSFGRPVERSSAGSSRGASPGSASSQLQLGAELRPRPRLRIERVPGAASRRCRAIDRPRSRAAGVCTPIRCSIFRGKRHHAFSLIRQVAPVGAVHHLDVQRGQLGADAVGGGPVLGARGRRSRSAISASIRAFSAGSAAALEPGLRVGARGSRSGGAEASSSPLSRRPLGAGRRSPAGRPARAARRRPRAC